MEKIIYNNNQTTITFYSRLFKVGVIVGFLHLWLSTIAKYMWEDIISKTLCVWMHVLSLYRVHQIPWDLTSVSDLAGSFMFFGWLEWLHHQVWWLSAERISLYCMWRRRCVCVRAWQWAAGIFQSHPRAALVSYVTEFTARKEDQSHNASWQRLQ